MGPLSVTMSHKDLCHCTGPINILVMHLLLRAHLVAVMNTGNISSTHQLLTSGYNLGMPQRMQRNEGGRKTLRAGRECNIVIRERHSGHWKPFIDVSCYDDILPQQPGTASGALNVSQSVNTLCTELLYSTECRCFIYQLDVTENESRRCLPVWTTLVQV